MSGKLKNKYYGKKGSQISNIIGRILGMIYSYDQPLLVSNENSMDFDSHEDDPMYS